MGGFRRRIVFATPFVVVACKAAPPVHHRRPHRHPPPDVVAVEPPRDPRIVDVLPPLETREAAGCGDRTCLAPHREGKLESHRAEIHVMQRVGDRWRVRFRSTDDRATGKGVIALEDGDPCETVEVGASEIDCMLDLPASAVIGTLIQRPPVVPMTEEELYRMCTTGHAICNPPPPPPGSPPPIKPEPPRQLFGNPPSPVTTRVLKSELSGAALIVTIAIGSERGLHKDMRIRFPKLGKDCAIVRIDKAVTICSANITPDQLTSNPEVEIRPPI